MLSNEGCEKALARIVNDDYYFENDPYGEDKASAFDKDVDMIEQLIEEHFKPKENTSEFKHFKLHSDSTLKNLTKIELVNYIKMLYYNWGVCDDQLKRVIDKAKECLYVVRPFITTGVRVKYFTCLGIWNLEKIKKLNIKFEENRFFPVLCANLES